MSEKLGVYNRQESMDLFIPEEIHILGVGGVGTWVAYNAALLGVPKIHIYDGDTLEYHNRNRLPYPAYSEGEEKTKLCSEALRRFRPLKVIEHPFIENSDNVLQMDGIIMNCIDYPMKVPIWQHADEKPIWTLGANETRYSITNKVPKSTTWNISDVNSYTGIAAPTVIMCASHAMGLVSSGTKEKISVSSDIRSLK